MHGGRSLALIALVLLLSGCLFGGRDEEPPHSVLYARTGWQRPLVHDHMVVFQGETLRVGGERRAEFDNLVSILVEAFKRAPDFDRGGPSLHELLQHMGERMCDPDREPQAHLLFHTSRSLSGEVVAEGLILTLGSVLERDHAEFLETMHLRLEDQVMNGDVDGVFDRVQFLIDSNTAALGALEVWMDRDAESGEWRYRESQVFDSGARSRERVALHTGDELPEVVDYLVAMIWQPFTEVSAREPLIVPREVPIIPRRASEIPAHTNFKRNE